MTRSQANIIEVDVVAIPGRYIHVHGVQIGARVRDGKVIMAILTDADHPVSITRSDKPIAKLVCDNAPGPGQKPLVRTGPGGDFTRDYTPGKGAPDKNG